MIWILSSTAHGQPDWQEEWAWQSQVYWFLAAIWAGKPEIGLFMRWDQNALPCLKGSYVQLLPPCFVVFSIFSHDGFGNISKPFSINQIRRSSSRLFGCKSDGLRLLSLSFPASRISAIRRPPMPQIVIVVTSSAGSKAAKPLAKRTSILSLETRSWDISKSRFKGLYHFTSNSWSNQTFSSK